MNKALEFFDKNIFILMRILYFILTIPLGTFSILSFKDGNVINGFTNIFVIISLWVSYSTSKLITDLRKSKEELYIKHLDILMHCQELERKCIKYENSIEAIEKERGRDVGGNVD